MERGDASAFDTISRTGREVLLGTDASHLTFRASVLVEPDPDGTTITVATLAATRSRAGRAYLAVVRLVHPLVVRATLRHAGRTAVDPWRSTGSAGPRVDSTIGLVSTPRPVGAPASSRPD
nr:DUF2867 domain-containing protein [Micromonospora nigra]